MRAFIKKITHPFLKFGLNWYYSKPRKYRYETSFVWVHPDIFPPHLTFSTKILLDFMQSKELKNKSFLELGCGSGIISVYAAKNGARVTASDINTTALEFLEKSASENEVEITLLKSDVFEKLQGKSFDCIVINPPYYPNNPTSIKEMAWFCGEHFEYFEKLFDQLPSYITSENEVFMILSVDCDLEKIKAIASKNKINFHLVKDTMVFAEKNYIFQLKHS
ncbi:MAG: methyltransferase [Bacteroidota bacterium]